MYDSELNAFEQSYTIVSQFYINVNSPHLNFAIQQLLNMWKKVQAKSWCFTVAMTIVLVV